jgi:hypothetical protein
MTKFDVDAWELAGLPGRLNVAAYLAADQQRLNRRAPPCATTVTARSQTIRPSLCMSAAKGLVISDPAVVTLAAGVLIELPVVPLRPQAARSRPRG